MHSKQIQLSATVVFCLIWTVIASCLSAQTNTERSNYRMELLDKTHELTPNDRLLYRVVEEQSPVVVLSPDTEGFVKFPPLSEPVSIVGKTCYELAKEVQPLLLVDFFKRATVEIKVAESTLRQKVTIYGQVMRPGRLMLPKDGFYTISQAVSQVGGFKEGADLTNVVVQRKDPENPDKDNRIIVDINAIYREGKVDEDIRLFANDVIIVDKLEQMGSRYYVLGEVKQPGLFTITQDKLTVSDAILLAGGFTTVARTNKVKLTRRIEDSEESETFWVNVKRVLSGDRGEDMFVQEDDIINVDEKLFVF